MAATMSFHDLDVYKLGLEEAKKIFILTRSFPSEEKYSLTDQIRRSPRAVNALLAEAWARRRYVAAFINKVNEALGEATETQAWLDHALACDYIGRERHRELDEAWQRIGAMLNRMIERADDFCKQTTK
jgi:four helix bundle protein